MSGSTTLAAANAADTHSGLPYTVSTSTSAATTAPAMAGQSARRLIIIVAAVTPAAG